MANPRARRLLLGLITTIAAGVLVVSSMQPSMAVAQTTTATPTPTPAATPTPTPYGRFIPPTPVFSATNPPLAFVVFAGGSVEELEASLRAVGATGAWAQSASGAFVLYIASGPEFVNAPFAAATAGSLSGTIAVTLVRGGDDAPAEVQLTQTDNGATVRLARGGTLLVALPSNPSTGYRWLVADDSSAALELVEIRYVPPGSTTPLVGAAGTEVLEFHARDSGTAVLRLLYQRPFEPNAPAADTFTAIALIP